MGALREPVPRPEGPWLTEQLGSLRPGRLGVFVCSVKGVRNESQARVRPAACPEPRHAQI